MGSLLSCASHTVTPAATATPFPTPIPNGTSALFGGAPPAKMLLATEPLGVSPDGVARYVVRARFVDRSGMPTALLGGGDVEFTTSAGSAQWQTRMRFDAPAAVVSLDLDEAAIVRVRAAVGPALAATSIRIDPHGMRDVAVAALGPHLVQIGWFPAAKGPVRIVRRENSGAAHVVASHIDPAVRTYRDPSVVPGRTYRYRIDGAGVARVEKTIRVPPAARGATLADAMGGKAMWLSYSPATTDSDSYLRLDPNEIAARAEAAGIHVIELRVAYGAFDETVGDAGGFVDALLDAAAPRGISIVAWTVPRSCDFEDLSLAVRATQRRTAHGHAFSALAVDLERGADYLGSGVAGYGALSTYLERLRAALGASYPIVATVEDPNLERLTNDDVPYATIAASADALQPMVYWRMLSKHAVTPGAVREALRASYAAIARAAERRIPIDLGAQTSAGGPGGAPSPAELSTAIAESHELGALGIAFFDWRGTSAVQWRALATSPFTRRAR